MVVIATASGVSENNTCRTSHGKTFEDITTINGNGKVRLNPKSIDLSEKELENIGIDSIVTKTQSAVVRLRHMWKDKSIASGSAMIISPDGFMLTADHVVRDIDGDQFLADFVVLPNSKFPEVEPAALSNSNLDTTSKNKNDNKVKIYSVPVKVVARSPHDDLALLAIALPEGKDPCPWIELSDEKSKVNETVYKIGHGGGVKHNILSAGQVTKNIDFEDSKDADKEFLKLLDFNWKLSRWFKPGINSIISSNGAHPGDSGGLICDKDGKAYGVIHSAPPRLFIALKQIISSVFYREKNVRALGNHSIMSVSVKEKGIPFLKSVGVDIDDLKQGKPMNLSNIIYSIFKRKMK